MKIKEITTIKGKFDLIDYDPSDWECIEFLDGLSINQYNERIDLSAFTCDQAKKVVEEKENGFLDYIDNEVTEYASDSLNFLIESLGIYLFENPVGHPEKHSLFDENNMDYWKYKEDLTKWEEHEEKTFYKPFLIRKWQDIK